VYAFFGASDVVVSGPFGVLIEPFYMYTRTDGEKSQVACDIEDIGRCQLHFDFSIRILLEGAYEQFSSLTLCLGGSSSRKLSPSLPTLYAPVV